jgi:hypothetical protein
MKFNFCLPLAIILCLVFSCKKQGPVIPPTTPSDPVPVSKTYGGSGNDYGQAVLATGDGGYVLAATSASNDGDVSGNHGNSDFWLVKIDKSGNIIWQKSFGGSETDEVYSMVSTADGGYLLAGRTSSNDGDVTGLHPNAGGSTSDAWVIKVDGNGKLLWQKALGGSGGDKANSIVASPDGGCVIAMDSESRDGDKTGGFGFGSDAWIVKLNAMGSIVWQRSVGGTRGDGANAIIADMNGGYIVVGSTSSEDGDIKNKARYGWFHTDAMIFKMSETGIMEWNYTYGGGATDIATSITLGNNGGYVMCGYTYSYNEDIQGEEPRGTLDPDAWIVRLFASGEWRKAVGSIGPDAFTSVASVPNVGYIASGVGSLTNTDPLKRPTDILFYVFDDSGSIMSQKSYEGGRGDFNNFSSIIFTQGRNYVIAGSSTGVDGAGKPAFTTDAWILHGSF